VDTSSSPSKQVSQSSPKSPKSGGSRRPLSVNSSPEKSPVHSPTSMGSSSAFQLTPPKDIHEWLTFMGSAFVQYGKMFEDNGMSLDLILSGTITDADLVAVGVSHPVHRKRILHEIDHQEKFRHEHSKRDPDGEESPASEPEDDPGAPIQSHVPVITIDDHIDHSHPDDDLITALPSSGGKTSGSGSSESASSSSSSSKTSTPPPPPDTAELPPPPPEDTGRVYPPPPG